MEILKDSIQEPLKYPISICFTETDFNKWNRLREQIKLINKNAMISELARKKIIELMNEIELQLNKSNL